MRRHGKLFAIVPPLVALVLMPVAGGEPVPENPLPLVIKRQPILRQPVAKTKPVGAQLSDDAALKEAGLSATEAGPLIEYLKARTLSDVDQSKIGDVIARFGSDDFDDRVKAAEDVEKFGSAAIGPLKAAEKDRDPEVAYRARQALKRMEKVPHSAVAAAAVRALVKLKPKDAAAVLLGFLPLADSDGVADEIRTALTALAVADGKAEPALVKALDDKSVLRRAAAYVALVEGGGPAGRAGLKEVRPLVAAAVRREADVDAKFRGLWALLLTAREKEFLPDLIAMIPALPRGRIWQLEEFLLLAAGDGKPDARFGKSEESLAKARDAWAAWWKKSAAGFDLAKFEFNPRITGYTDIVEYNPNTGQSGLVTLGPDMKVKVHMEAAGVKQLSYPTDVKKLPNGNYLIAEHNSSRLTERDSTGTIIEPSPYALNFGDQPVAIDLVPGGGLIVVFRNQVIRYGKDMKPVWTYTRPNNPHDICAGRLLPSGDVVIVGRWNGAANAPNCHRLAAKDGKEVGKPVVTVRFQPQYSQFFSMDAIGEDKVLVCELNRVVEYDLKTGKEVWKFATNNTSSCQRLPNGNTLVATINTGRALEVDPAGEVVWEYESKDGMRPSRAFRR